MQIVGFDVSKHELVGVRINKRAEVKEKYTIENGQPSIERFLDKLLSQHPKVTLGSEATSEYHNVLAKLCLEKNIPFYLLNPIVTKRFTKATIRKKKTDLTDAQVIAQCILLGEGELTHPSLFSSLKPILRTNTRLSRIKVSISHMKNRLKEHFHQETALIEELLNLEREILSAMQRIKKHAHHSVDKNLSKLLCSIPGIGDNLAAVFIAEIGSVERFNSAKSLIAFSGLDPKIRQSGTTLMRNTKITKRGSPFLRRAAFIAASIAQRHDPQLKMYYEKKRNEGKRYTEATIANARHILSRVYAVWKRGTPYLPKT